MHQRERVRRVAVEEVDLGRRVLRHPLQSIQGSQADERGTVGQGRIDLFDLVGFGVGQNSDLLGFLFGSFPVSDRFSNLLLLLGFVTLQFGLLFLTLLFANLLVLDGLFDMRR